MADETMFARLVTTLRDGIAAGSVESDQTGIGDDRIIDEARFPYAAIVRALLAELRTVDGSILGKVDEVDLFAWEHIIDAILAEAGGSGG